MKEENIKSCVVEEVKTATVTVVHQELPVNSMDD